MPFIKLMNTHKCDLPTQRPNGAKLAIGDEWQCDVHLDETGKVCGKIWRWSSDQRDGDYWMLCPTPGGRR